MTLRTAQACANLIKRLEGLRRFLFGFATTHHRSAR